ncbi:MAG: leucine-rich repeat protein [Bacteroides sp.]|nr:leucine-rich repeat protein [Bacteroides sp.]
MDIDIYCETVQEKEGKFCTQMRTNILKIFYVMVMILAGASTANAYDFDQDGLYYNILSEDDCTVAVFGDKNYNGDMEIPKEILYNSKTYTVTTIGEGAFSHCSGLTSVDIPNSVTTIGDDAFFDCNGLTSVVIPNSVTTIGEGAFSNCSGLTSVEIPSSVTSIGESAFFDCNGLTSVKIPNSVTTIGMAAFYGCSGLTSVVIPNSVTTIGMAAFSHCSGLTSVEIPSSVTTIGREAFFVCSGLTSVVIPSSVTSIGDEAFSGCSGLTSVTIPSSVASIGDDVFKYCSSLESVYCQWTDPIECNPQFPDVVIKNAALYVPKGAIGNYEKVDPWRNFKNIKEMDYTAGVEDVADRSGADVKVTEGCIVAEGCAEMEVYSMSGQLVYRGAGRAENLAAGIYVVRVADKTLKVMVAR